MARKFLYVVALLLSLAIIGMIAFSFFGNKLMRSALVPRVAFAAPAPLPTGFYDSAKGWISRPDGRAQDPARWQPPGQTALPAPAKGSGAAVFFIHPTSAFDTGRWNASANDPAATAQAERLVRLDASALASAGPVWAPHYRQAVFGAFLTDKPAAQQAFDVAYGDVKTAFGAFLRANPTGPIILAGHSQGTMLLLRLLHDRVGAQALTGRIVAVYAVGWPISLAHDLPALGLPACHSPAQTGCIVAWQSFAPPADTSELESTFDHGTGFDGKPRAGSDMLCTNPLDGGSAVAAPASTNLGMLFGDGNAATTLLSPPGLTGARCEGRGILMIDSPFKLGTYVLPGNNYHVYDYSLFWANIRADAQRRLAAWQAAH